MDERFGEKFTVYRAFKEKIDKWAFIKDGEGSAIRKFADFMQSCLSAMNDIPQLKILNEMSENQKLLRDFKLAQIAMFFIKQRVDRVTINDQHYIDLMQACYAFLVGYVRENLEN